MDTDIVAGKSNCFSRARTACPGRSHLNKPDTAFHVAVIQFLRPERCRSVYPLLFCVFRRNYNT